MTLAERISDALVAAGKPLDDNQLAAELGVKRQAVNQVCRSLAAQGRIARGVSVGNKIQNVLLAEPSAPRPERRSSERPSGLLKEDEVKAAVRDHLATQGFEVAVAWGHERGIDIEAHRGLERILLEAKGEAGLQPQQVNYFLGALGELIQRMDDPDAFYGLALPDNRQYRGLVDRLPSLARERLNLMVFFVQRSEEGLIVSVEGAGPRQHT